MIRNIYIAGPLFTIAELEFNLKIASELSSRGFNVFLPQIECSDDEDNIFTTCKRGIENSDLVLANCDGADADSGTSWECGYAFALRIPVVIFKTDCGTTDSPYRKFNLMLSKSADIVINEKEQIMDKIISAVLDLDKRKPDPSASV